ncbi:beta-mannosidase [Ruminiclostridium cellobioparum]|uniref:beta-mannosidase n=1 Tax=Ruminiclostridium cellobioparum TaxID=29355 RepID=UPI000485B437|nr:glycoside hydrolase family 2 protein [Ruminiclostridium cellobioparum]
MKRMILEKGWKLRRIKPDGQLTPERLVDMLCENGDGPDLNYTINKMPSQVHDVLYSHGIIENPNIMGHNKDTWIDDFDWVYFCDFKADDPALPSYLYFKGLDTYADIYLNGQCIARFDNVYLQHRTERLENLKKNNTLMVYFHSSKKVIDSIEIPEKYTGRVPANSCERVFRSGFHDYNGPFPSLIRCGIYSEVVLEQAEKLRIREFKLDSYLNEDYTEGTIACSLQLENYSGETECTISVYDGDNNLKGLEKSVISEDSAELRITVEKPQLWWPRTHGKPYLYTICICCGSKKGDQLIKKVGFRKLELAGDFDYRINGHPLKLWGVNLTHPDTLTNCYNEELMNRILDLAELGNCNIVRVWGESEIYDEAFYDQCDSRGIMVWQDFYLCYSMYSEEPRFIEACRMEAEQLVKKLRHHACILLWCGGNEMLLSRDYDFPGEYCFGEKIFMEVFPEVCKRLDPGRLYHPSSPYGGKWANDPSAGDTHGYTHLWFVPERDYPVFLSENCRVSTPPLRTMKKMMTPEELWPEGYTAKVSRKNPLPWPESWCNHNTNIGHIKLGPVEHYYDADSPGELIYRIGAAHAEYIRRDVERFRRGRSAGDQKGVRKTKGHMLWKFNNNSNIISYGVIDYFQEPYYPYYALKRAYEPILLSCEFSRHGYVWMTNDTMNRVEGTLDIKLLDMDNNSYVKEFSVPFSVMADESKVLADLDEFGQFRKRFLVCAKAFAPGGGLIAECIDVFELERHLMYPVDTGLEIVKEGGNCLVITSKKFARCVELLGNEDGDEFGWLFSDNYFDLLPDEPKKVMVLGRHSKGIITAKAVYDDQKCTIEF